MEKKSYEYLNSQIKAGKVKKYSDYVKENNFSKDNSYHSNGNVSSIFDGNTTKNMQTQVSTYMPLNTDLPNGTATPYIPIAVEEDAKKRYGNTIEAYESMNKYASNDINSALNNVNREYAKYKNEVMSKNDSLGIKYNKNSQYLTPDYTQYVELPTDKYIGDNKYKNRDEILKNNEKINGKVLSNSEQAYVNTGRVYGAANDTFNKEVRTTDSYRNFEDYDNAKILLENVKDQRDIAGEGTSTIDKFMTPVQGFESSIDNLFSDRKKYRLDNNNNVKLPTKSDLKAQQTINDYETDIGRFLGKAGYSIGQQVPSIVAGAVTGGMGLGSGVGSLSTMFLNVAESSRNEKLSEGYTEQQANQYALMSATIEVATEKMFDGLGGLMGKGSLDGVITDNLTKNIKNRVLKTLARAGISSVGEGIEEVTSDLLQPIVNKIALGDKRTYGEMLKDEDLLEDFIVGSISSVLMSAPSTVVSFKNNSNVENYVNNQIENSTSNKNQSVNSTNNINNRTSLEQYSQDRANNNIYTYEKTNNVKINNMKESASRYFNNTEQTHNFINSIEKTVTDKNYNILFDNAITNKNGNEVNAQIKTLANGEIEIRLNPNSSRSGEFLIMHEVTHAIETDSMKKLILDYASKNTEFSKALESLKQAYGTNDVSSEVVADISGQLFGNQEFINNLSMKEPNIFKKIYNKIIEIANKFTGNSRYDLFVKDLKNKWEEAYRTQNNNLQNGIGYSQKTLKDGTQYIETEANLFIKEDGTPMSQREVYNSLIGKTITFNDGITATIVNRLPSKDMYNELFKRLPTYQNVKNVKDVNNTINENVVELLENSKNISPNEPDYMNRHQKQGISTFDTRLVSFFDGSNAYNLTFSIAKLNDGKYVAYAKRNLSANNSLLNKIKKEMPTSKSRLTSPSNSNIPQSNTNVNSGTLPKYSMQNNQNNSFWQEHLEKNYKSTGTRTYMQDIKMPISNDIKKINSDNINISMPKKSKVLDPIEISKLTKEDANTTPLLPNIKRNKVNDGNSNFYNNIKNKTNILNEQQKNAVMSNEEVQYYDKVTNKETLEKAFKKMDSKFATESWFGKDSKLADSVDVAQGWILLKQYADNGDTDGMVAVAKKMRDIGTKAGQTVQAFNLMERMTPEGMVKYAQSELQEAYDLMVKNKSKAWIDKYRSEFDLKTSEVQFIMDNMKEIVTMEDGYDKRVKLAEIQKLMTDKLPPEKGARIKSWMRISMLFNPKTQVRNVVGNAIIAPVNYFGDLFSSYADKIIAKKTNVRTTGNMNVKAILKGFKDGAYQATNDYRKGINTKDMEGNRFEIGEGKSFSDKNLIGRNLNRVESLLNYVMDAGDRMFSQSSFENSLQNQMVLNNTTEITQDMIDIARTESLQRTWNDNNNYTKVVLDIRRALNKIGTKNYGLGDILIPFAKTPANLTKAIVDYSPAGLVNTILQGNNLRKSLTNGQYTPQMQHKFVQSLGKATAGTMLYIAGYALAKAGITTGKSDDDKDTANFLKNTLGISSYSIKIGDKTFTYDWAQPLAAPFSITANIVSSENKEKALLEAIVGNLDTAGSILLEQSFLESLNDVLNSNDEPVSAIANEILELPARAIPTFSKQIADMVDGTQRTSYEYGKPVQSAINSMKAKIPFVSKTLAPAVDTMGREIQKYGGKNNLFNVFLNPANVNTENISESAEEIYRLYKETGQKDVMPRVAPYYINKKGEKIVLSSEERAEYQKESGKIIEKNIERLLNTKEYKNKTGEEQAEIVKDIINYSYNIAQKEILGTDLSQTYQKAYEYSKIGNISDYYTFKNSIDNNKKESISKYLINSNLNNKQLAKLYESYYSSEEKLNNLLDLNIPIKEFIKFDSQKFEADYNSRTGASISGSARNKVIKYVNSLSLTVPQKAILIKSKYNTYTRYDNQIIDYVKKNISGVDNRKLSLKRIGFDNWDNDIIQYVKANYKTVKEREKVLKDLGFTVRDGKVYK